MSNIEDAIIKDIESADENRIKYQQIKMYILKYVDLLIQRVENFPSDITSQ